MSDRRGWWWRAALMMQLGPVAAAAQVVETSGVLNAVWGDPIDGSSSPRLLWTLTDPARGTVREVMIPAAELERPGGIRALDRRSVTLQGIETGPTPLRVGSVRVHEGGAQLGLPPQLGARPIAVIMCKFSDVAAEPTSISQLQELFSNTYPNLDHYYRELSAGQMNLAGSTAFGWFVLPAPRSSYVTSGANLTMLAQDCTAAADAVVDFSGYWGIAFQFNADLDGFAWGGSRYLTLDGVSQSWPMIWMPLWATQSSKHGGYAHELGHALGWSHSSGGHGVSYDSEWDVMSDAYLFHYSGTGTSLPGHTIAANKSDAAWIPVNREITVNPGQQLSFTLEQAEFPVAGSNPLLAWITIPGSTSRYSLEARRLLGYDEHLPGEAVIIHRVSPGGVATVIDPDGNDNPNDAAAMWLTGETFNSAEGIAVAIGNRTAQGWQVTVTMPGTVLRRLNVAAMGTGSGVVTSSPAGINCTITAGSTSGSCSADFPDGGTVALTAVATQGNFEGWSGDCSGSGACTVLMDRTRTATARFHLENRTLTVDLTGSGGGSVISSPAGIDCRIDAGVVSGTCATQFGLGETVMLYQAATSGTFEGWTGACGGITPCQVVLDQHRTVGASFELPIHSLTLHGSGDGSGLVTSTPGGVDCVIVDGDLSGDCVGHYPVGTVVTLAAAATAGEFSGWSGACSGSNLTCQVIMNATRSVTAGFAIATHQLTIGGGGTGSGSVVSSPAGIDCRIAAGVLTGTCSAAFQEGAAVLLTVTAEAGEFSGWEGACTGTGPCQVVMDQPHAVAAGFQLRIHQLVVTGSGGGRVTSSPIGIDCNLVPGSATGSCSAGFVEGTAVTLSASATGGIFTGWSAGCTGSAECQVAMNGERTVTATFATGQEIINLLAQWLMTGVPVSSQLRGPIDRAGNGNGTIDIGDLAALVDRTPNPVLPPGALKLLTGDGVRQ